MLWAPGIDVDPAEVSKNVKVHVPIVGDAKQILKSLNKYVKRCNSEAWLEKIEHWKKEYPFTYKQMSPDVIMPQFVVEQMGNIRCGLPSTLSLKSPALSSLQAVLAQWATVSLQL